MINDLPKPKCRRRWPIFVISTLFILGALFVATRESFHSRAARLRPGLTRREVLAVMGEPDHLMKLGNMDIALFTPLPFALHALLTKPGPTLAGQPFVTATEFPAYVEFQGDIATRVCVDGHEVGRRPPQ